MGDGTDRDERSDGGASDEDGAPPAGVTDPLDDDTDPLSREGFTPEVLDRSVLSVPLLRKLKEPAPGPGPHLYDVVIDVNLEYRDGREAARDRTRELVRQAVRRAGTTDSQGINEAKSRYSDQYMFARLEADVIRRLVVADEGQQDATHEDATHGDAPHEDAAHEDATHEDAAHEDAPPVHDDLTRPPVGRAIYRIWPDFEVRPLVTSSGSTVKADAARTAFNALGSDIVWAVVDSGIDREHPHFALHHNLDLPPALEPVDFTTEGPGDPFHDELGHGTHVAGILAGELHGSPGDAPGTVDGRPPVEIRAFSRHLSEQGRTVYDLVQLDTIGGIAPRTKLLSLKVLDKNGSGTASSLIAALEHIQRINGHGRRLLVHGVNISVGYDFEPEWFACGQSPLCVEVDRLVRSGVVVVVAAGNTGYGHHQVQGRVTAFSAGIDLTINDPGNADLAITVGSTHRDMPHVYGVSYFSSKGPTGDGRHKPDLVAPGEKILSCAAGSKKAKAVAKGADCNYLEDSGTSMAAPHVSGVIAAFLSVRREFIGRPQAVKEIFCSTATDLGRDRNFQGHGLVDLMRAIQSV